MSMESFYVINKQGASVPVDFNKILLRLKNIKGDLPIDIVPIAQHTIKMMVNGVTTRELDNISVQYCANSITSDVNYDKLAVRIEIDNLHRETSDDYLSTVKSIVDYRVDGELVPILHPKLIEFVNRYSDRINKCLDYSKDFGYSYFGLKTLMKSYLIKHGTVIKERPQHMLMRVAIGINLADYMNGISVIDSVLETYRDMSSKLYTHATPTLFNAGTHRQSLSSCFLLAVEDDLSEIYRVLTQTAMISKWAGGIGIHVSQVRAQGSLIKSTNGTSEGIAPMLKIFNDSAVYVSQGGGKRKGSTAVYLETWHADIESFLDLKKPIGDESKRARDLFLALWVCDLFMERLVKSIETKETVMWSLFCPSRAKGLADSYGEEYKNLYISYEEQGLYTKQVPIDKLWKHILEIQMESGVPYIVYKDHVNRKNNQNNLGTIKSSNLCVTGDTKVLTSVGYIEIKDIVDKEVEVWNGSKFSKVTPRLTGIDQKVVKVKFDDGVELMCTEYHKFYLKSQQKTPNEAYFSTNFGSIQEDFTRAFALKKKDEIIESKWPLVIVTYGNNNVDYYTLGYFLGQPRWASDRIIAYHDKKILRKHLVFESSFTDNNGNDHYLISEKIRNAPAPFIGSYSSDKGSTTESRIAFLSGCIDSCGRLNTNEKSFNYFLEHSDREFLMSVKLVCNTLGMNPRVRNNKLIFRESETVRMLRTLEISPKIVKHPARYDSWVKLYSKPYVLKGPRVVSVEEVSDLHDTYCFTEQLKGKGIFNGVITGNCAEINIFTDKDNVGVCNLASICLSKFVKNKKFDYTSLHSITKKVVFNLNKVIDNNIYPVPEGKYADDNNRPLGVGVQSLAKVFFKMGLPFVCEESRKVNKLIFETIYHGAMEASVELAKSQGPYKNYEGSLLSEGKLQFDLWGVVPSDLWDWENLRNEIAKHGARNSLLLALMPTASTAQIMNNTESFEPITSNIFVRNTLSGTFQVVNKHLIKSLKKINMWNENIKQQIIEADGSVQSLNIPPKIKEIYKTVWEISQKHLIEMEADRNAYVCQATSSNRYLKNPSNSNLTSMHIFSWRKGLKTGMYYLRSQAASNAVKYNVQTQALPVKETEPEECLICMA